MSSYTHKDLDRLVECMRSVTLICFHYPHYPYTETSPEQRLRGIFSNEVPFPDDTAEKLLKITQEPIEEMPLYLTNIQRAKRAIAAWRLEIGK